MNPHRRNYTPAKVSRRALQMLGNTVMTLLFVALIVVIIFRMLGAL